MTQQGPFEAVISDMDGVITRTASLHEKSWKKMFDEFLQKREGGGGEDLSEFTDADYREYVDGKPRFDGVRDFLAARSIDIPEGDEDDGPDADTVQGLGTRKNQIFHEVLDQDGVAVYEDTIAAFDRWQLGGLPVVTMSSSRNCRRVLETADQLDRFDAVIDGQTAAEEGLDGKKEMIPRAAREVGADVSRCVLLEDATSGVKAGLEAGCGLVVGVSRDGEDHARALHDAGAHRVVDDVAALRLSRHLATVDEKRDAFEARRQGRPLCVFLDFDGTLSEIVDDPGAACITDRMRAVVRRLADQHTVAVVSGRDLADVRERVQLADIYYAGSHGLDIAGPDRSMAHPDAEAAVDEVDRAETLLRDRVGELEGAVIERKRFSVAAHYRMVAPPRIDLVKNAAAEAAATSDRLRARRGKKVVELVPDIDWDKGRAVDWLLDALAVDPERTLVLYIGDDETDEDAFHALAGRGLSIHVGPEPSDTLADLRLADPDAVAAFLAVLAGERGEAAAD